MKRLLWSLGLFVAAVLLVASIVASYASPWAEHLVNPSPAAPPTTTTSKEVTAP